MIIVFMIKAVRASNPNPIRVPTKPIKITGRRPLLSEILPHIGANTNCIALYDAIRIPKIKLETPRSILQKGSSGITIPNPKRSIKTAKKRKKNPLLMDLIFLNRFITIIYKKILLIFFLISRYKK
jgi:hypothetical protein